jgi:hypothetical protein
VSVAARLAGYAVVLGLAAGGGAAVGASVGPEPDDAKPASHGAHDSTTSSTVADGNSIQQDAGPSGNED